MTRKKNLPAKPTPPSSDPVLKGHKLIIKTTEDLGKAAQEAQRIEKERLTADLESIQTAAHDALQQELRTYIDRMDKLSERLDKLERSHGAFHPSYGLQNCIHCQSIISNTRLPSCPRCNKNWSQRGEG